jgi:putative two-component system response regulator
VLHDDSTAASLGAMAAQTRGAAAEAKPGPVVLLVAANAAKRRALRAALTPLGHPMVEASSGPAALRAVAARRFAVILMDVRMPTMSGYEAAKRIRARRDSALTPIIFMTDFGGDETETAAAYASGAVDFLFAPIADDALRAKVTTFIDLSDNAREHQDWLDSVTALNASLRDSEVRAHAVLQNVADGIVTIDEQGLIESVNRSARGLFGYDPTELVGRPWECILAPSHRDELTRARDAERARRGAGESVAEPIESLGLRKDGSLLAIEIAISEMQIGERAFTIGAIRDITERAERAERERREAQALRRDAQLDLIVFEEAPIGSVITSRDGRVERVNIAICAMLGQTPEAFDGVDFLELTHPEDGAAGTAAVAALVSGALGAQHFETRYLHSSGRVIEARVALTAIRDDLDEVAQLFAQIEDVTDARRTSRELEQAQFEMLARLAAAGELHNDDTGQHTLRVAELSVAIAREIGLPEAQIELLRRAAPLHDVGKIAISDALLCKRGKLTAKEFEQVKTHTTAGAQMLAGSPFELLALAEQTALTHHERWDGSGYPAGLAGEAIPITGRIVAVADVFDALTHNRPYKDAWTTADAITEVTRQAGRHFDPLVVDAFRNATRPH